MFCPRCGKVVAKDARFCSSCGAPIEGKSEEKYENKVTETINITNQLASPAQDNPSIIPKKKRSSFKIIVPVVLGLCLLTGVSVYGFALYKETSYKNAVAAANGAIEEHDYDTAIDSLNRAIKLKPGVPENYLTLAIVYVEKADLYSANEVLVSGYSETEDSMLKDASIWGPASDFEIALWCDKADVPLVRQEYRFSEAGIQSLLNAWGRTMFVTTYFFDDAGHLAHTTLSDYSDYTFGGGDAAILDAYYGNDLLGELDVCLDYTCDETGRIVSVSYDGEQASTIVYGDGIVDVFFGEYKTTLHYGSDGRVTQVDSLYDVIYEFQYSPDGSFVVILPDNYGVLRFDNRGYWYAFEGDDADAFYIDLDSEGRVLSVVDEDGVQRLTNEYSEKGLLKKSTYSLDLDYFITVRCTYDSQDILIRLDYEGGNGNLDGTYRDIEYSEYNQVCRMVQYSSNEGAAWESYYKYTDTLQIASVVYSGANGTFMYEPVYSSYGGIIDYECTEAVYIPGTYTGVGIGFNTNENIVVSVTVDYNSIISITVDDHGETVGIGTNVFEPLSDAIIAVNGTNVDTITGATITSHGFIDAVNNALSKALVKPEY